MNNLYYEKASNSIRYKYKNDPIFKVKIDKIKEDIKNKKDKK